MCAARPGSRRAATRELPPSTEEAAAHSAAYSDAADERFGALTGPATRLSTRELCSDPAVVVFFGIHALALATLFAWRPCARDALLVFVSYTARMFGESE